MFRVIVSNRLSKIVLAFFPILAFLLIGCSSAIYPTFSHQGKLLDSNGNPVADGSYTVMYRLYHDSSGGTAVYTDTNSVNVTDGYFDTAFGEIGVDPKIFSEQTWVEITINGETLTPRQYLRGAPYASGLVAGSAVIGSEPVTYTYSIYDNLGSAFFAANTDNSETGGSGITAVTSALIPAASSGIKEDVAAVRGLAVDANNGDTNGAYAGIFVSEGYRGLYVDGDDSYYAAYFEGDINVTGTCFGCTTAMIAQNVDTNMIEPGDFVAAAGVEIDPNYEMPILLVRKAVAGDTIVGVAESAIYRGEYNENTLAQVGYEKTDGDILPDGYVSIVTEGLVQARLSQTEAIETGAFITGVGSEVNTTRNPNESMAQVMSAPDEDGLQWILLNR